MKRHAHRKWEDVLDDLLFLFLFAFVIVVLCAVDPTVYSR